MTVVEKRGLVNLDCVRSICGPNKPGCIDSLTQESGDVLQRGPHYNIVINSAEASNTAMVAAVLAVAVRNYVPKNSKTAESLESLATAYGSSKSTLTLRVLAFVSGLGGILAVVCGNLLCTVGKVLQQIWGEACVVIGLTRDSLKTNSTPLSIDSEEHCPQANQKPLGISSDTQDGSSVDTSLGLESVRTTVSLSGCDTVTSQKLSSDKPQKAGDAATSSPTTTPLLSSKENFMTSLKLPAALTPILLKAEATSALFSE